MIQFQCDYNEGAHEKIMDRLCATNMEQTVGYGCDDYCAQAAKMIKEACGRSDLDVHFLVGGTQANTTVIASALRPYEGVVSATTGHINVHETGAIESSGHKVLALACEDGKLDSGLVRKCVEAHLAEDGPEHMVKPGMVYISQPTELGSIYSLEELKDIYGVCREFGIYLFVDGARLGYGLTAEDCDMTLPDLAANCDVFYIGGTKVGALFGEAVVISNRKLGENFRYMIKQRGGMLAKGRLLGIQFLTLFEDNLYFEIARRANVLADDIREALEEIGADFLVKSRTNQIFPILPDDMLKKLSEKYLYSYQERIDDKHSAVRFCTSWATKPENVRMLCEDIRSLRRQ